MKIRLSILAAAAAVATAFAAHAQTTTTTTTTTAEAKFSVEKTPISIIWADPVGKAILLKALPPLEQYMDQIKDMTLAAVAPMSQGAIDDAKLKEIQAELDKVK